MVKYSGKVSNILEGRIANVFINKEIFKDYAKSFVFIGNYKKNGSGSGFVVNHKRKKIITNWHVIEGTKKVRVWLKPENFI